MKTRRLLAAVSVCVVLSACGEKAPRLEGDEALDAIFRALHEPVYQVYEIGVDRDAIHEHLASSFAGEALTEQYIEHFTTLVRMGREKTSIRVVRVDYEGLSVESGGGTVLVDADWSVGGIVTHQEHKHLRTNRYRALYELEETADGWRIVGARLRDLRRVDTGLGLSNDLPTSAGGLMSPLELLRAGVGDELPDDAEDDTVDGGQE